MSTATQGRETIHVVTNEFERLLDEVEQVYLGELMRTEDAREGIRAFLEKRASLERPIGP